VLISIFVSLSIFVSKERGGKKKREKIKINLLLFSLQQTSLLALKKLTKLEIGSGEEGKSLLK
jgi:hypothetical protein